MDKPVGGGSDDSFVATGATLGALDVITGGAGADTLTITDTTKASEAGFVGTVSGVETLVLSSTGGMGAVKVAAVAAGTNTSPVAQKISFSVGGTYATGDTLDVSIGGVVRTVTVGSTSSTNTTGQAEAATAVSAALTAALADSATIGSAVTGSGSHAAATSTHAVPITSGTAGSPLPSIIVTKNTVAGTATAGVDTAAAAQGTGAGATFATANVVKTGPIAIKEIEQITITDAGNSANAATDVEAGTIITVNIGGVPYAVAASGASSATAATAAEVATNIAAVVNTALGGTVNAPVATASGAVITVTATTAGTALPTFDVTFATATDFSAGVATATANQAANTAGSAEVAAVAYKASAFDTVTAAVAGDINTTLSATATAVLTTTAGSATVSGGADVTVTATKGVGVSGAKVTNATVKAGTTSSVVTIGATGAADTTVTPILQTAKVTGGSDVLVTDEYLGVSTGALTSVEIAGTKDTTVTLEGKSLTNLTVGTQKSATTINITNAATAAHTLNVTAAKAGVYLGTAAVVTVADLTAEAINVEFTAANANVALDGDATLLTVVASGAGGGKLDLNGGTSGNGITSFSATSNSGGLAIANIPAGLKTIATGSGADSFTMLQTAIVSVNSGGGADVVTIDAALAAGSTVNLQDGNDVLLKGSSGSVATDSAAVITSIDGGDGTDTLGASFITAGNGDQFKNFEVLGLTNSTVDASLLTGSTITDLALIAGGGTYSGVNPTQSLTVTNIGANSGTTTLSYGVAGLGATDTFTVNFADPNADLTTATAWAAVTSANVLAGTVTAQGVENYALISGGTLAWNSITLGANTDAETVTITGASNLDLAIASSGFGSTTAPATGVTSIDGSAATGKLTIDITGVVESVFGIAVKGGSAADTITTGGEDVTLTLGAGADTVVAAANKIAVASAGNATAAEAVAEMIAITDLGYGDIIDFTASTITSNGVSLVDVSAATTLLGAINIAANDGGTSNVDLDFFYYGGNTYALYDAAGSATGGIAANDVVIKITGLFDLSNSVLGTDGALTITA